MTRIGCGIGFMAFLALLGWAALVHLGRYIYSFF